MITLTCKSYRARTEGESTALEIFSTQPIGVTADKTICLRGKPGASDVAARTHGSQR